MKTMENPKLDKFRSLIDKLVTENELDITDVATALAFENQKDRPLFPRLDAIATPSLSRSDRSPSPRENNRDKGRKDRNDRGGDRKERGERPQRESVDKSGRDPNVAMVTYRLEVGHNDGISPSNIVGAIANEADISSQYIGEIKLHDEYSTVDLPEGMPTEMLTHLQKVRVCAKPMRISVHNGNDAPAGGAYGKKTDKKEKKDSSGEKKTISRDVTNKRTADSQMPPKKSFKKKAGGSYAKDSADKRASGDKTSYGGRPSTDGSSPIKKKKTYTKKPKKSKS